MEKEQRKIEHIASRAETSEKEIERYLVLKASEAGGLCLKYTSQTMTGFPDRLCVMPDGKTVWAEIKSAGKKPRALQQARIEKLRGMGHKVYVVDSKQEAERLVKEWEGTK